MKKRFLTQFLIYVLLFSFLPVLFLPLSAFSADLTGKATRILDGDTFHFLSDSPPPLNVKIHKDGTVSVRLRGCDAPEKDQPYGREATENLKELLTGKNIRVKAMDIDRYGRIAGYVYAGSILVNLEQVKAGYAWAYAQYLDRPYASEFYDAEKEAREKKRGLWQEVNPVPPWEWRKARR